MTRIQTPWGDTTESMRLQAIANMRVNPDKRREVEALLIKQAGGDTARGLMEFQRRYPEIFSDAAPEA